MKTEEPVLKRQKLEDLSKGIVKSVSQSQFPQAKQHLYKTKYILKGHTKPVTCARFSPDGKLIATACKYKGIWRFFISTRAVSNCEVFLFFFFFFHLLAADTTIRIWSAEDGRHLATLAGHLEGISDISWAPDSQIVASASDDKTIRLWNIHTVRISLF
jgi:COMPASS component SWD3